MRRVLLLRIKINCSLIKKNLVLIYLSISKGTFLLILSGKSKSINRYLILAVRAGYK